MQVSIENNRETYDRILEDIMNAADDQQIDEEQFDLCSYFGQYQTEIGLYMVSVWSEKFGREVNNPWYDVYKKKYLSSYEEGIQLYGEELIREWMQKASLYLRKYFKN